MKSWVEVANTPTADAPGFSLVVHFDNKRYLFGQMSEGTQRALVQRSYSIVKLEHVFLSGVISWQTSGGLLGLMLTLAESWSSRDEREKTEKEKEKDKRRRESRMNIHGGRNLAYLLATARRFIFRRAFPLVTHETSGDSQFFQDENLNIWQMALEPDQEELPALGKRSHDEFVEGDTKFRLPPATPLDVDGQATVSAIVARMFDKKWSIDELVQTTLHKASMPAKIFVRDDKGRIQPYSGPLPGPDNPDVPDIPVLVRKPWPASQIHVLPPTIPSKQSMCYIAKGHERRGKFLVKEAERLGVDKTDFRKLTNRETVTTKEGTVVTPDMVLDKSISGTGFALIDLPHSSYIGPLLNRSELSDSAIMAGVETVFWSLGRGVIDDPRLQEFMKKMPQKHLVSSVDSCPNMITFESHAAQNYKLWKIDPERFPLPRFNNNLSISGRNIAETTGYEQARIGQRVQFSPEYMVQNEHIQPFADLKKMGESDFPNEISKLAVEAQVRSTDPEFLERVEKAEVDIPNRDAEIIPLGTGSAQPSKYRSVSSTLVRVPGYGNYLFDAGENTLGQLHRAFGDELPSVLRDLKAIWISHLHADHHLGTASIIKAWHEETKESRPDAKLLFCSHGHMLHWLMEYSNVEDIGYDRVIGRSFSANNGSESFSDKLSQFGLDKVEACRVDHCYGALATAFTFKSGLKIAYSGDCRPSDAFVEMGKGATLLIHESTFDDELQGDAIAKKHSTMSEAIDVGRRMGARRILLTHFSQRYQKIPINSEAEDSETPPSSPSETSGPKKDVAILLAFDLMRVRLGDFKKAQIFLPTIQRYFELKELNQD